MSFVGKLTIDEQDFNILKLKLSFQQPMDANMKPNANPNGGLIYLSIESPGAKNPFLGWMLAPDTTKEGEIKFSDRTNGLPSRVLSFSKAFCVSYDEDFNATGSAPMTINLVISAQKLTDGEEVHEKGWEEANS